MVQHRTYRAFFSYARADAEADPKLIEALTKDLEERVNVRFSNDRFEIWRDVQNLRLGDNWELKLEHELRVSDILIVLLTPRWLGSENCSKEYEIFEEGEASRSGGRHSGSYVATILVRELEDDTRLTDKQKALLSAIRARQYERLIATNFLKLAKPQRTALVDSIADDICGIIERRRSNPDANLPTRRADTKHSTRKREYGNQALNYEDVDFIRNAEVVVDRRKADQPILFAQVDFVHRLYIQGDIGRIEFGVRRAYLRITNDGPGELMKVPELKGGKVPTASYVSLHDTSAEIAVCMDPSSGKPSLAELALPPAEDENYLSKLAIATNEVSTSLLKAELQVSLNAEGIYLASEGRRTPRQRSLKHIGTIIEIVMSKTTGSKDQTISPTRKLRRKIKIADRT